MPLSTHGDWGSSTAHRTPPLPMLPSPVNHPHAQALPRGAICSWQLSPQTVQRRLLPRHRDPSSPQTWWSRSSPQAMCSGCRLASYKRISSSGKGLLQGSKETGDTQSTPQVLLRLLSEGGEKACAPQVRAVGIQNTWSPSFSISSGKGVGPRAWGLKTGLPCSAGLESDTQPTCAGRTLYPSLPQALPP